MAAFNFPLNPRLQLNGHSLTSGNPPTSIGGLSTPIVRPPPPPQTAPPPNTGHLVTMHHPLIASARPILFSPQGFSLAASQFYGDSIYQSSNLAPAVLSSGLNDAPLEFNVLRPKSDSNNLTNSKEILQVPSSINQMLENQEKHKAVNSAEMFNYFEKKQNELAGELPKESTDKESDDDDCQVINEIPTATERINVTISGASNLPSQTVPVLTSGANVWKNLMPNMNVPLLNVNQMLTSNIIDSSLFPGQTFGVFGPVLSQLSNPTPPVSESNSNSSVKTIIHGKSYTLFPPNANAPAPTTRERPLGCKTVFVGGLPENIKEEVIREIFGFCGEIGNIRLSNKKFCHIRFAEESAVDQALTLSGYRIRLGSSTDSPNTGRLHVDFAHARDDQFEWECKQRQIQREQRHRERMLRENDREISPSTPNHFTESEANSVLEKLKGEDTFAKAISVAVCWLDRGECNKRNVNTFYSMIQSVNSSHVRRLLHDKNLCESEFKKAKDLMRSRAQAILTQFAQIEKLFVSSSHKKVWDHFTKAQRKNIELWKKAAMEIKKLPVENEEVMNDEMDVSDSDDEEKMSFKKRKIDATETNSLNDENDSLRCQLEAYKNEICVIRTELQCELGKKDEQINVLQKTLTSLTQEAENLRKQQHQEAVVENAQQRKMQEADTTMIASSNTVSALTEKEAKLIGLVSIFLHIHPFGAGVDYICSFLQKTMPSLRVTEIELVMNKFPTVFQQEVVGIGANMERRWKYAGFNADRELLATQS